MSYSQIGLELVKVVITALLAAVLVHLLEHRHFIRGRWWERKADAYESIIDALVSIWCVVGTMPIAWRLSPDKREKLKLDEEYGEAAVRLLHAASRGDYIISKRAAVALRELLEKGPRPLGELPDGEGEWENMLDALYGRVSRCLEIVRDDAKRDLQVKWYKWW